MSGDWTASIFSQKSMWEVYRLSNKILPKPKSNVVIFWAFVSAFLVFFGWAMCDGGTVFTEKDALSFLQFTAAQGLSLAVGILGFLIAGFAIFASVTKAELFITLAEIPYKRDGKETGINRLQFVFFNFLNVFTVYIGLLALCLIIGIGLSDHSPLLRIASQTPSPTPILPIMALVITTGSLLLWLVAALLRLKSFVWNLYQTILVSIATEAKLIQKLRDLE